jgi:hypothetical protein
VQVDATAELEQEAYSPNMGDQVWLMTSRQTLPLLGNASARSRVIERVHKTGQTYTSSMFGWKILFKKPILGDLYGNCSGNSTCIFHTPLANGARIGLACGSRQMESR